MASILATLVLDDGAMEVIKQRHEGHLLFEATLRLLSHVMTGIKFAMAMGGDQIMGEGMTHASVKAAMQQLNGSSLGDSSVQSNSGQPLVHTAANRPSQHEGLSSMNDAAPALARRLSTDAQQVAALLAEASTASKLSSSGTAKSHISQQQSYMEIEVDGPEPLDLQTAVSLAEACAQAMWGSAHYSLEEPLHITQVTSCCCSKLQDLCCLVTVHTYHFHGSPHQCHAVLGLMSC